MALGGGGGIGVGLGVRLGVGVGVGLLTVQLVPDEGRLGRDSLEEIWGDIGEISGRYTEDIGAA